MGAGTLTLCSVLPGFDPQTQAAPSKQRSVPPSTKITPLPPSTRKLQTPILPDTGNLIAVLPPASPDFIIQASLREHLASPSASGSTTQWVRAAIPKPQQATQTIVEA